MTETKSKTYKFLEGGGQMGHLVRVYDWSATPVGPVDRWPQSLRTMVDVILHSDVPMLLWWGEELIQFYNDAYRPSLGKTGKHPQALGQRCKECWPEIWPIIKPYIDCVHEGGAVWRKDQLIPIFRDGGIEDVYWTFGYSPVRDEEGNIAGVLVVVNETTQQVKARQRMEESQRTLRSIIDLAPVGICIVNGDDLCVEVVNDIFLEISGRTREESLSKSIWELFPSLRAPYAYAVGSVLGTGKPYKSREDKVTFLRDGAEVTLYLDLVIEQFPSGRNATSRKLMILAIDATDKVVARQQIEESEKRYKTLITESTVAIALYTGPEMRIQYVNEIMVGYWGKDMSVIGKTIEEAVPELKDQHFLKEFEWVYTTGESYVGIEEEAILRVDGKLQSFYFNYVYKALKDADGKIYGIHHMAMDVTEQVLARKKVEQNEATLRDIILNAPVAMCILRGPEFVLEISNDAMFRMWGKGRDELIGRPIFESIPEVRNQGFEEILGRVYATGESYSAHAVPITLRRNGVMETIFVNFLYEAYHEANETVSGVLAVATDITEQVKARQRVEDLVTERTRELANSNKNLKRSNDELAQFAYIASHDLQEPARKITTFTEMLQQHLEHPDPRTKTLLDKIESSSARMLALIRGILTYSQLSREKQPISRIDLNEVVKAGVEDFELLIEEKQASIEAGTLPVIEGMPIQINQLFGNLISNALKFTSKTRKPRIVITATEVDPADIGQYPELKHGNRYYKISFADNGIGFSQDNARQIFDIFQRLHGRTEYEGTGIGLAMCKKIAQNHNGDITAESIEGEGATFHVFLPYSPQEP